MIVSSDRAPIILVVQLQTSFAQALTIDATDQTCAQCVDGACTSHERKTNGRPTGLV